MTASEKYKRFDAADYLETLDDVAAFLEAALEDSTEDPTAVPQALGIIARIRPRAAPARPTGPDIKRLRRSAVGPRLYHDIQEQELEFGSSM